MKPIDRFCQTALHYTQWCLSVPGSAAQEAQAALQWLQTLQQQAEWLRLPSEWNADLEGERPDQSAWDRVYQRASALPFQFYELAPDSKQASKKARGKAARPARRKAGAESNDPPLLGDLADDIADVYRDIAEGLSLYSKGHCAEAEWALRFSYDSHWGTHARDACKVLVSWLAQAGS